MLSKTELLFLKGELDVGGNVNYERVLTCRIKKKVEKGMRELEETVPLLSLKPQLREWIDNYGITVIKKEEHNIDRGEMSLSQSVKAGPEGFEPTILGSEGQCLIRTGPRARIFFVKFYQKLFYLYFYRMVVRLPLFLLL